MCYGHRGHPRVEHGHPDVLARRDGRGGHGAVFGLRAAGIDPTHWSMKDVVALLDARAEAPKARGPYKPRKTG